jgi:hypothetical protein
MHIITALEHKGEEIIQSQKKQTAGTPILPAASRRLVKGAFKGLGILLFSPNSCFNEAMHSEIC